MVSSVMILRDRNQFRKRVGDLSTDIIIILDLNFLRTRIFLMQSSHTDMYLEYVKEGQSWNQGSYNNTGFCVENIRD